MILLDDLLNSSDFRRSVDGLAKEFRTAFGLPDIHQLGLAVPSVEKASALLEARGFPPFFIAEGSPILWRELGRESSFRGKAGFGTYQGFELELLEPGSGSNFYHDSLDPDGRIVVQHLGFLVKDTDEWAGRLEKSGHPVRIRGRLRLQPWRSDFAYMDTQDAAGVIVEFISFTLFGRPSSGPPPGLFRLLGRLEKWSGKRSISVPS